MAPDPQSAEPAPGKSGGQTSGCPHKAPLALRTIALFEAAKGALAFCAAFGVISLRNTDLQAVVDEFLLRHGMNPETHYKRMVIESLARATDQHAGQIIALALIYSAVRLAEAYGLWREKHWAEWFGVISAGLYLPFELVHMVRHPSGLTIAVILLNVAIVIYLARLLFQQRAARKRTAQKK
jgi:uncharacterized membrane protein (DUF2068 family)